MTIQYPAVAICPFCEDGPGDIDFNIVAFEAWCGRHEAGNIHGNLADVADQRIILFRSDSLADSPCEHLLQLSIGLRCAVTKNQYWMDCATVRFDWINPLTKFSDPDDEVIAYMWDQVPEGDEVELDQFGIPNRFEDVYVDEVSMHPGNDGDLRFYARGKVVYAEDVYDFFEELKLAKEAAWLAL